MNEATHTPVLTREVIDYLEAKSGGDFLDCTFGGGGHSRALLEANTVNKVNAIDRDARAVDRAADLNKAFAGRFAITQSPFSELEQIISFEKFDGILADLGLSSQQLFEQRGFSFRDTGRLDMRMDDSQPISADEIVNGFSERELTIIFKRGGVGSDAGRIARMIVRRRPFHATKDLAEAIEKLLGTSKAKKVHPATVVFQAIRMEVNQELQELEALLNYAPKHVKEGGKLAVISFHSLEDKVVASTMRAWQSSDFSASQPGSRAKRPLGRLITRKALVPSADEIKQNPRARSARMRVFKFI